ncbi:HesA/MoeB/ThiF family protein [Selenihalanaerobacter shriftii]|uniref:Molybdopterin or thiamine biosynthesis adenylyltransferase n=1 Tax=Selenihalanaerobacter shriftii TaxID=142842 RepID=A0A1T4NHX7_9FIRM|nr:molybdopterin-synthase adenylyltransferase MoeB [Selenihalanaerobacter shriftii]SJZ78657.1 Molybdopterin or thiamine biosynthesis adenylyltransferase [Selenihalanaerobacter shriftii]
MNFSEEELERYSRHIILEDVGVEGQYKLLNSSVLIIGAGGLGTPAAQFLAAAGIGKIGIVDADKVELSNLQRQVLHYTSDVGNLKVESVRDKINEMNPDVEVKTYPYYLNSTNIREVIKDYDFIIDGTDNFPAKFLINDVCVMENKAFSHAGIIRFTGQTTTVVPGQGACYRCLFPEPPSSNSVPSCKEAGVIGVLGGILGTLQATEAIKYILDEGELLTSQLLTYDALAMNFRKIDLEKRDDCEICGSNPEIKELIDYEQGVCEL